MFWLFHLIIEVIFFLLALSIQLFISIFKRLFIKTFYEIPNIGFLYLTLSYFLPGSLLNLHFQLDIEKLPVGLMSLKFIQKV